MSHNPNTVKSQDELSNTNDGKRSSEVLLTTLAELEKTKKQLEKTECELEKVEKQLDIAVHVLEKYANRDFEEYNPNIWDRGNEARKALICIKVKDLNK